MLSGERHNLPEGLSSKTRRCDSHEYEGQAIDNFDIRE